ncbi:hypothetical protein EDB92DRAFT_2109650 [Lactarius akahatsu]|uniref:Uncharacterized protein n=1 Tax=Lactarius akahatsu TaxID=416441 RepID=A0AAD4Q6X4_9AGAM|nr:hypothetical protein EDB92DRAFT_2109650 [Lactarius akahatsu]
MLPFGLVWRDVFNHFRPSIASSEYEKRSGTNLIGNNLVLELEYCDYSTDTVITVLQHQARAFRNHRGDDGRVMKRLKRTVQILYTLSTSTVLGEGIVRVAISARKSDSYWFRNPPVQMFGKKHLVKKMSRRRLDRLTHEARMTAAQTPEVVYGLVKNMRVVTDDEKASLARDIRRHVGVYPTS